MTAMIDAVRDKLESKGLIVYEVLGVRNAIRTNYDNQSYYFYDEFVHVKIFVTDLHMIDYSKSYKTLEDTLAYIDDFTSESRYY